MNKTEKAKLSSSIGDKLKNAQAAIVSDFTGIKVPSIAKLRRDCRKANIDFMVVKNSLFKRAIKDTQFAEIDKFLDGPTSVALSTKDPVGLAKALVEFARTEQNLKLKGGMFDGKIININDIKKISALPPRDVLLSMVLSGMKSPHRKLVFVLNGVVSKFVNVMSQIKEKKEKQSSTNPK